MIDVNEFIKSQKERFRLSKWHKDVFYFNKEEFETYIKNNKFRVGRATKTVKELKNFLSTQHSEVLLSECDENLIPLGRINDCADRDYVFFKNTTNALKNLNLSHSFFINYTGHCGSVGAVLALKKVPLIWQLDLREDAYAEKRIINQIQDFYNELAIEPDNSLQSFGLMLECPHGDFETFNTNNFPTVEFLKENNITNVYILTEDPATTNVNFADCDFYNDPFKIYANKLNDSFNLKIIPVDQAPNSKELVAKKEKIKKPEVYYLNFNCKPVNN